MWAALMAAVTLATSQPSAAVGGVSLPADRTQLAGELIIAQRTIDDPASSAADVAAAGQLEQLATAALVLQPPRVVRAILAHLSASAAATMRASLAAAVRLRRLTPPRPSFPPWKIVAPPPPATLLGYFREAQARFGVPWEYLAAIEFVETRFGRVVGLSTAGAEGPMQFLPATWAAYGRGDVHNPRAAVFGAARYLSASGAPTDMPAALFHYNPSGDYVAAVEEYAARMRADDRAYYGYYNWQVIFAKRGQRVILPVGYPTVRPLALRPLLGAWRAP